MVIVRQAAWLSALVATAIVLLLLSPLAPAGRLEEFAGGIFAPAAASVRAAVRPAADVFLHAGQIGELSAENADLRRALERSEADLAALREERARIQQASALVAAVGDRADQFVTAAVLARDPTPGRHLVLIDRGARHGVRPGQPVLGAAATLVGIVSEVDGEHARIRLITDRESAVSVMVQSSRTPAALAGTGEGLRLDFVPHGAPVAAGDVVLTAALGGLLPPGLLAGKVTSVQAAPQALHETVVVEPLSDLARLEELLVMTGFTPGAELPLPPKDEGR
ncbi:MAG: rod shape-determining protein MreC [Dehalococcoidia bacterium]